MSKQFTKWAVLAISFLVLALAFISSLHDKKLLELEATIQDIKDSQELILELQKPKTDEPLIFKSGEPRQI